MNIAHMAYHANRVLEKLGMETLVVAFWQGLWEGRGDISVVPDDLLPEGDTLLFCPHCKRQTQHTETETLPGGYPLLECVICDGEKKG